MLSPTHINTYLAAVFIIVINPKTNIYYWQFNLISYNLSRHHHASLVYINVDISQNSINRLPVADPGFPKGGADPIGGAKVQRSDIAEN